MKKQREPGYYHVRMVNDNSWQIAYYAKNKRRWTLNGSDHLFYEMDIAEIDENRIVRFDKGKIVQLVEAYGNASFDCGEFDDSSDNYDHEKGHEEYKKLLDICRKAKSELLNALGLINDDQPISGGNTPFISLQTR